MDDKALSFGTMVKAVFGVLVGLSSIAAAAITYLQYTSLPQPFVVPSPRPDSPPRSDVERERDIEKGRREALEKALKDIAAARQTPPDLTHKNNKRDDTMSGSAPAPAIASAGANSFATQKPCIQIGRVLERPILVGVGSQLCPSADGVRATIHEITSYSVIYSVPGSRMATCQRSELCTFSWDGAPLFNIDVIDGPSGRTAQLVNAQ